MADVPPKALLAGLARRDGAPHLVLDAVAPAHPERRLLPIAGRTLTLTRLRRRLCVGRYSLGGGGAVPCPDRTAVADEYEECFACRNANGFNPAFDRVDPSTLSAQQKRYNARPHSVYLAHFGGDVVKVGISSRGRLRRRLVEQGARAAVRFADAPTAWDARAVEVAVAARGLSEVVHDATKRRLLGERFDAGAAQRRLRSEAARLRSALGVAAPADERVDLADAHLGGAPVLLPLVDLTEQRPFRISGRVLGLVGKVLVVEQRSLTFAASLSRAVAHVVALTEDETPNPMPPGAGQLSLLG